MRPHLRIRKQIKRCFTEKTNLNDGLIALMVEEEAWRNLSREFTWNESLLEKYKDKVDWEEISSNSDIEWTVPMLEKFKGRLNWKELSGTRQKSLLSPDVVERFKDRWDWKELSNNSELPIATIRKMADYIDWKTLIDTYRDDLSPDFLKEFEDRIPASALKGSRLWDCIVEEKAARFREEIVLG